MNTLRTLISVAVIASLAACGGGGSSAPAGNGGSGSTGNGGSGNTGIVTLTVPVEGNLQTGASSSTYAAGSVAQTAFAALNAMRVLAGAGVLVQSTHLDVSAAAHEAYLDANAAFGLTHIEDATKPSFYAAAPADRMTKAGYSVGLNGETIGGADVAGLVNTVYHGAAVLGAWTNVGLGTSVDFGGFTNSTVNFAAPLGSYGQVPAAGSMVTYPYAGQTGTADTFQVAQESPRPPVALLPNATAGSPVLVSVRNADFINAGSALNVTVTEFSLKDASGNLVPVTILSSPGMSGAMLHTDAVLTEPGFAVLVPLSPLVKGQTYSVSFSATLKTGGAALAKVWTFTTAR